MGGAAAIMLLILIWSPIHEIRVAHFLGVHTLLEITCVMIGLMIFSVQLILRRHDFIQLEKFQLLGLPFLGIALLDLAHALSFPGMPEFVTPGSLQKSISFWLAARGLEALAFLFFATNYRRTSERVLSTWKLVLFLSAYVGGTTAVILASPEILPSFVDLDGSLSTAKVGIELIFVILHLLIAWMLLTASRGVDSRIADLIVSSMLVAISGAAFTTYRDAHDMLMLYGHVLKVLAYFFILRSCLLNELIEPFQRLVEVNRSLQEHSANLRDLQSRLTRSERLGAIGESLATVVHDLNNMLFVTEWSTERIVKAMSGSAPNEDVEKSSAAILMSLRKTREFQKLLLSKAKGEGGGTAREIRLAVELAEFRIVLESLAGRDVQLDIQCDNELSCVVDPLQLEQVLMNLVVNARDALKAVERVGGRRVLLSFQEGQDLGRYGVWIRVRDNGRGMRSEDLSRVFDPFYSTKSDGGTGLGLATVKSIVDAWGGRITVQSREGEGSEFQIWLPRSPAV